MKTMRISLILLFIAIFAFCEDLIEIDLTDYEVVLLAPSNGISTEDSIATFYWEEVKGASAYKLQIVSPEFSSIERFVLDTLITDTIFPKNSLTYELTSDNYQWRVKALNASSQTDYSVFNLTITSSK